MFYTFISKFFLIIKHTNIGSVWIELILLKLKTENWKHCSKIIFKCVNSIVGPNFNEKVTKKWDLWVPYTIHGPTELIKRLKSQQLPATVHMNSSRCSLNECAAAGKLKKKKKEKRWRNVNANAKAGSKPSHSWI